MCMLLLFKYSIFFIQFNITFPQSLRLFLSVKPLFYSIYFPNSGLYNLTQNCDIMSNQTPPVLTRNAMTRLQSQLKFDPMGPPSARGFSLANSGVAIPEATCGRNVFAQILRERDTSARSESFHLSLVATAVVSHDKPLNGIPLRSERGNGHRSPLLPSRRNREDFGKST